jgi:hypothetical protein
MPRRKALSYWRARIRKLADAENSLHVADAEIVEGMDEVYGDLYHIAVDGAGEYFETSHTITATGAASYDEPDDHLSTVGLERVDSNGTRTPLRRLEPQQRHRFGTSTGTAVCYSLVDDKIYLYPRPSSGTYELLYIPQPPDLTSYVDADLLDVVCIYGAQFLVYGVAALVLAKSESQQTSWLARQQRAEQKLIEWAAARDFHGSHVRVDGNGEPLDELATGENPFEGVV